MVSEVCSVPSGIILRFVSGSNRNPLDQEPSQPILESSRCSTEIIKLWGGLHGDTSPPPLAPLCVYMYTYIEGAGWSCRELEGSENAKL